MCYDWSVYQANMGPEVEQGLYNYFMKYDQSYSNVKKMSWGD